MLRIYFHQKFSGFILTGVPLLLAIASGTVFINSSKIIPLPVQLIAWPIILLMFWAGAVGYRQFRNPSLMYSADRRGVMIYWEADRVRFGGSGVFLPWTMVTGLSLEKRSCSGLMTNRAYTWVIACNLKADAPFPIEVHGVAYMSKDGTRVICLDAFTGTVSQQQMLEQLRSLWQSTI